jgi:hypothetical protein
VDDVPPARPRARRRRAEAIDQRWLCYFCRRTVEPLGYDPIALCLLLSTKPVDMRGEPGLFLCGRCHAFLAEITSRDAPPWTCCEHVT